MPNAITIPQYFKANGYEVVGTGKVFHNIFNDSASWFVYYPIPRSPQPANSPAHGLMKLVGASPGFDWSSLVESDEEMGDFKTVQRGIDYLNEKHQKPFFLAVGLIRPHLPMYAPQKYFDLYPLSKIKTPAVIKNDLDDVSPLAVEIAHNKFARQNRQVPLDSGNHNFIVNNNQWEKAVQAYLASISFADAQVGRLMNALENSPYKNNTIIVFFGDNGWHLGEKDHWGKSTLWEESGHVPFIIVAPGFTKPNSICERTVSLMDIYPTLINLCKLPAKPGIEAMDITPLLKNPKLEWNYPAITTYGPGNHAVRTERWRYIRYNDKTEELYDHNADPNEWNNLAKDPKYADTIKRLSVWLPKTNAAPAAFIERPRE